MMSLQNAYIPGLQMDHCEMLGPLCCEGLECLNNDDAVLLKQFCQGLTGFSEVE